MSPALRGVLLIVLACALIAGTTVLAKSLGTGADALSPIQITWGRFFFAMLALVLVAATKRPKFQTFHKGLHVIRVSFGVCGVTAMFAAAALIPLADATAIAFLNPILAMCLAAVILRERVALQRWAMAGLAFVGMLLLVRPGTSSFQPAALIALFAALMMGVEVTVLKMLSGREPAFQILLVSNVGGAAFVSIATFFVWQMPTSLQWLQLISIGLVMLSAQSLFIPALRSGDASFVVPFTYSTLLFAGLYDFVLYDVIPTWVSVIGAALIIGSGMWLAWKERRAGKTI